MEENWIISPQTHRGTSESIANFSGLSNHADAQAVSCLGLCGRDICPKCYDSYGLSTFNPHLSVCINKY